MDELLSMREAAEKMGVVYQRITQLIAAGSLKAVERDGRRWIPLSEISRYIEERRARLERELASLPEIEKVAA